MKSVRSAATISQKVFFSGVAMALLATGAPALATQFMPRPLDHTLVDAAGVVFATVVLIGPTGDSPERDGAEDTLSTYVSLDQIVPVFWNAIPDIKSSTTIAIRGESTIDTPNAIVLPSHRGDLVVGGRYMFIFEAGGWDGDPFASSLAGVYPVDEDTAIVQCAGGEIYGLSESGLICSTRERQFGDAMTEDEVRTELEGFWNRTRARVSSEAGRDVEVNTWAPLPVR